MQFYSRRVLSVIILTAVFMPSFIGTANAADQADKSQIVGKWELDLDAMVKLMDEQVAAGKVKKEEVALVKQIMSSTKMSFEFKADGKLAFELNAGGAVKETKEGSWSVVSTKDNTLTLNTKVDDKSEEVLITVLGKDAIAIHPPKSARGPVDRLPLKRAK